MSEQELIQYCNERMAYFMVPRYLEFMEAFPKTPKGEIEKQKLRDLSVTARTWDREKAGIKVER